MSRTISGILLIVSIVSLIACGNDLIGEPNLVGRVVDKDSGRILVIGGITKEEMNGDLTDILESGEYREAYWIRVSGIKRFEEGDEVKVWFTETEDSYPAQTSADRIEIIEL